MDKGNKTTKDSSVYSLFSNITRNRKPLIAWAMKHNNESFTNSDTGHVLRQESKKQHLKLSFILERILYRDSFSGKEFI